MNILFTICARAGSKGVRSKNIRMFAGFPLVCYTLAAYSLFIEKHGGEYGEIRLAVNTDSEELLEQINQTRLAYTFIMRKEALSGDAVAKIDVIRDTLFQMEEKEDIQFDIVLDLDLTSPLRTVKDIKGTLDAVLESEEADLSFSVTESRRSPYFNMVCKKENGFYNTVIPGNFAARQQVPACFDMNASIYAYKRAYLLSGRTGERNAVIWRMQDMAVLDIDSEEDYELLGLLEDYYAKKEPALMEVRNYRGKQGESK